MRWRRAVIGAALAAVVAGLAGCGWNPLPLPGTPAKGGTVTVAVSAPFTSVNPETSFGDTETNHDVAALTRSGFGYYDDHYRLVRDESFGRAEIVSKNPFTVRYSVSDQARWSDGTPVDARDLLLTWAAESGALNASDFDPSDYVDATTGRFTDDFPKDVVWFDGRDARLATATQTPVIRDSGRAIDVTYSAPFAGWPIALEPTLPAHVVGRGAVDGSADDVAAAIEKRGPDLPAIARYWNQAGNLDAMPDDDAVLASSGPYAVSAIGSGSVTLRASTSYRGERTPTYQRIRLRVIADPLEQVDQLRSGDVDIATPQATADVVKALIDVPGVRVSQGAQGVFEHLDFQIRDSYSGTLANADVRRAFLHVVPRTEIVQQLIQPVDPEAQPLRSFTLPPGSEDYAASARSNGSKEYADVDVDTAKALLQKAGVSSPVVCILYDPSSPRRRAEFELIRSSAAEAGFQVTDCSNSDWRSLLGVPGSYDAALFAWDTSQIGTASIGQVYRSGESATNLTGYASAEVDALVDRLATADSTSEQQRILAAIDTHLWADAYGAPLFQYPAVSAVHRSIANVSLSPLEEGVFWNAWTWAPSGVERGD